MDFVDGGGAVESQTVTFEIAPNVLAGLLGLLGGAALGASARYTGFCSFAAIADWRSSGDLKRWRGWLMAIAVAVAGTQALHLSGAVDIKLSGYLSPSFFWAGAVLGGLAFGFGMALAGGCGLGLLVRAGGGDGRALFGVMVLAIAGYATMRGVLAMARLGLAEIASMDLNGPGSQSIGALLAWATGAGVVATSAGIACLLVIALAFFCLKDADFRQSRHLLGSPSGVREDTFIRPHSLLRAKLFVIRLTFNAPVTRTAMLRTLFACFRTRGKKERRRG